jgi:DNA-binding transcriptional ArsR family regulator
MAGILVDSQCDVHRRASPAGRQLDVDHHFDDSGSMDTKAAVRSLAALAQESRLDVFRLLVQVGPEGLAAGEIADRLGIPASTLSFHIKALSHAGLAESRQQGRFVYYSAHFSAMNALIAFLGENCCNGRACLPAKTPGRRKRAS